MNDHQKFRFSVTCSTQDYAVVCCLRALCQYAEDHPKRQIGWGGTKESDWRKNGERVTLRFTSSNNRKRFINEATRLLNEHWKPVNENDNDPARAQRP